MTKVVVLIRADTDRQRLINWIKEARLETRVEIRGPKRTIAQNDRLWAMLSDIVLQKKEVRGRTYSTESWKSMFLQALGHQQEVLPTLDGNEFFATGFSSSRLSKQEMSDLIDFIFAWGAENDVLWSDPELRSIEAMRR